MSTREDRPDIDPPPPLPFAVLLGADLSARFRKMSGMDAEGRAAGSVVLQAGIFPNDAKFWDWLDQIRMNTIARSTVVIHLLDARSRPTTTWTLIHALPTRITGADMDRDGTEVAVESLEIAYEMMVTVP